MMFLEAHTRMEELLELLQGPGSCRDKGKEEEANICHKQPEPREVWSRVLRAVHAVFMIQLPRET